MRLFRKPKLNGEYCSACGRPRIIKKVDNNYSVATGEIVSSTYVVKCPKGNRENIHDWKLITE